MDVNALRHIALVIRTKGQCLTNTTFCREQCLSPSSGKYSCSFA